MKKISKLLLLVLLIFACLINTNTINAEERPVSDVIKWIKDSSYNLAFSTHPIDMGEPFDGRSYFEVPALTPWYDYRDLIKTAGVYLGDIEGEIFYVVPLNMANWFGDLEKLEYVNLKGFDTSNVEDMSFLFGQCYSLKQIDNISVLDTSKVKNMECMFGECRSLQSLDLSGFNTENVENMDYMFYNCKSLKALDLSGFDVSKVSSCYSMFDAVALDCLVLSQSIIDSSFRDDFIPASSTGNWYDSRNGEKVDKKDMVADVEYWSTCSGDKNHYTELFADNKDNKPDWLFSIDINVFNMNNDTILDNIIIQNDDISPKANVLNNKKELLADLLISDLLENKEDYDCLLADDIVFNLVVNTSVINDNDLLSGFKNITSNILSVFDLSLITEKYQNDSLLEKKNVKCLDRPITVELSLTEEQRNKDSYYILHDDNGEIKTIIPIYDKEKNTLLFETDSFSPYAVCYTSNQRKSVPDTKVK